MNIHTIGLNLPNTPRSWMLYNRDGFDHENDGTLDLNRVTSWLANIPRRALVLTDVEGKIGSHAAMGEDMALNQIAMLGRHIRRVRSDCKIGHYGYPTAHNVGTHIPDVRQDCFVAGRQCAFLGEVDFVAQSFYMLSHHDRGNLDNVIDLTSRVAEDEGKPVHIVVMSRYTESDGNPVKRYQPVPMDAFVGELEYVKEQFASMDTPVEAVHLWHEGWMDMARYSVQDGTAPHIVAAREALQGRYRKDDGTFNEKQALADMQAEAVTYCGWIQKAFAAPVLTPTPSHDAGKESK